METIQPYAAAIRRARVNRGLSQRKLAARTGLTQAHLSRFESGQVDMTLSRYLELARALDFDLLLVPRQQIALVEDLLSARAAHGEEKPRPAYTLDEEEESHA